MLTVNSNENTEKIQTEDYYKFKIWRSVKHEGWDQSESNHTSVVQSEQHLYTCNYTLARWLAIVFMVPNPY